MCKHWKYCKFYENDSDPCNKNSGGYYPDDFGMRPAGCYVEMEQIIRKNKLEKRNRGE